MSSNQNQASCRDGVDQLRALVTRINEIKEGNEAIRIQNKAFKDKYDAEKLKYDTIDKPYYDGEAFLRKRDLENENRTSKCVNGDLFCNSSVGDCSNDHGYGWVFSHCISSNCGAFRRIVCKRSVDKVESDLASWVLLNPPPIPPTRQPDSSFLPYPNPIIAINCCQNISTVIDSTIVNSTIEQINNCITNLNIQDSPTPSPPSVQPSQPPASTPPSNGAPSSYQLELDNNLLYLIGGGIGVAVGLMLITK